MIRYYHSDFLLRRCLLHYLAAVILLLHVVCLDGYDGVFHEFQNHRARAWLWLSGRHLATAHVGYAAAGLLRPFLATLFWRFDNDYIVALTARSGWDTVCLLHTWSVEIKEMAKRGMSKVRPTGQMRLVFRFTLARSLCNKINNN